MPSPRTVAVAVCAATALLLPAAAGAATVTVTNDAGQSAPLTEGSPLQIRHMAPAVTPAFSASEKRYSLAVTGPDGKSASLDPVCVSVDGAGPQDIVYAGNGAYAVKLVTYANADDIYCEGAATTQSFTVVIAASVTLTGPASPLLYREPGGGAKDLPFTYDINPGAGSYGLVWAYNAQFGAGGAIVGDYPKDGYAERSSGVIDGAFDDIRFPHAGNVSVVAAATAGHGTSPYSAPVALKLMGPFDWSESPGFTGGRGRTHVIGAQVFEPGVVGSKVSVLLAKRSGKFKPFVSKTISSTRKLSFKVKKPRGKYRLKYVFAGADLVAPGAWTQRLKIGKGRAASLGTVVHVAG